MRHRDGGQALIPGIPKDRHGPLHQAPGGRSRQGAVQRIGLRQQCHIVRCELAGEAQFGRHIAFGEGLSRQHAAHEAGQLLAGIIGGPLEVAHHHTLIGPFKAPVAQAFEHRGNERVALGILAHRFKLHLLGAVQKGA